LPPADIPLDFAAKASIAVGVDGLLLGRRPAWPERRACGGASIATGAVRLENEAMATRQPSKQTKRKAEAKVDATNRPGATNEREPQRRNRRVRSRFAARTDRAEATATAVPKASLNGSAMVHDNAQQARLRSKSVAAPADLATSRMRGAEQPLASTKRAQLINLLERPEGASVAEIGQRLGWLPHTVRAAITGLRKTGREVTRSKDADDRSVYRLAPAKTAGAR